RAGRERNRPALAAERLRRVRDQVEDDLSELRDVGLDRRRVRGEREREARLLRERALNQLGRLSRNAVDAYGLDDVLPLARVREHLLRQVGASLRRQLDRLEGLAKRRLGRQRSERVVRVSEDDGEQVVEVVGDPAGEDAEALELLRLDQALRRALHVG